jgi:hypothetical protein
MVGSFLFLYRQAADFSGIGAHSVGDALGSFPGQDHAFLLALGHDLVGQPSGVVE